MWHALKDFWNARQVIGIAVASFWLAWLFVEGFRIGLPEAARNFIDIVRFAENWLIGVWLDPLLENIIASINTHLGWNLAWAKYSRYAFNLLTLKLVGDSLVDYSRFRRELIQEAGEGRHALPMLLLAAKSKKIWFLFFEWVLGATIALGTAIAVSQYSFEGQSMSFAYWVLGGVCLYELAKGLGHLAFNLYDETISSNAKRYLGQFWLLTCLTSGLALMTGNFIAAQTRSANDSLLCVYIFIALLALQQFVSTSITVYRARASGKKTYPYFTYGQVTIGIRMLLVLLAMLGWILIAVAFDRLKSLLTG